MCEVENFAKRGCKDSLHLHDLGVKETPLFQNFRSDAVL